MTALRAVDDPLAYPAWSLDTFTRRIDPVLKLSAGPYIEPAWLDSCCPGPEGATRFRLFPGSLFLLWLEALGVEPGESHSVLAAAIELLHNASLHHDDVLDRHDSRRGQATLRETGGPATSLLAGDALLGAALRLLAAVEPGTAGPALPMFARAWLRMNHGQSSDEPTSWSAVPRVEYSEYWERTTRDKLAIGNLGPELAATIADGPALADRVARLHEDFSLVSQIQNDLGDIARWAGFHVITACQRAPGHESRRKPTLTSILAESLPSNETETVARRAQDRIRTLTDQALCRLQTLELHAPAREVLHDFFVRPLAALTVYCALEGGQ